MIFGRTKAHKQAKLKFRHDNRLPWFAWKPVKLQDGRWVWFQEVWVKYPTDEWYGVYTDLGRHYPNKYYLTEIDN